MVSNGSNASRGYRPGLFHGVNVASTVVMFKFHVAMPRNGEQVINSRAIPQSQATDSEALVIARHGATGYMELNIIIPLCARSPGSAKALPCSLN